MLNRLKILRLSYLFSFLVFSLLPSYLFASVDSWIQQSNERQLHVDRQWQQLLHLEYSSLSGYRSYVADAAFFLSAEGSRDPSAEMAATITAFFQQPATQCRFVARRQWLVSQLPGLAEALPVEVCENYHAWRKQLNVEKVVLVFASSYLNSPSSMYGHTFLRFDPVGMDKDASLMSYALNFGANVSDEDNGLLYAYKGVAGGYPGAFASGPYLEKVKEYSRFENRDLWEYELNLSAQEIDFMLAHIWELDGINFSYYFFDENCSYRLLELLEVARKDIHLTRHFPYVAIPLDTVRVIDQAGMVERVSYRPSHITELKFQIAALTDEQKALAKRLSDDIAVINSDEFLALSTIERYEVVHVAYGYLRYGQLNKERDDAAARRSFLLLKTLNTLAVRQPSVEPPMPERPDYGHKTSLASVAVGVEKGHVFSDLEYRVSYHDLLDNVTGYAPGASLNGGRVVLRQKRHESLQLQALDVVDITSLSVRDSFFQPLSWRVNVGMDRQWVDEKDVLTVQTNAGVGATYAVTQKGLVSALLTTRVEYNEGFKQNVALAVGGSLGTLFQNMWGSSAAELEAYHFTNGHTRTLVSLKHNINLTRDSALRLQAKYSLFETVNVSEFSVNYRYYY